MATFQSRPMDRLFLFFVLGLLVVPSSGAAQTPEGFNREWTRLSEELRDTLTATGMVGGAWAFLSDGQLVAHESFGQADLETGRTVDEATIFHWGSITKTLNGIAIMQLRDRGLLSLDDPLVSHVPELKVVYNPFGAMEDITLRHLLSHSAGFRSPTWPWGGGESWHPHEPTGWEQIVAMLPYTEVLFPPGSRFHYSNPGVVFLAQVVERITGEEWEVYVEKNILRPLGMSRTYFDLTPYHLLGNRSNNYTVRGGVPSANGLDFDTGITVSNSGLNSPLDDMARYLAFLTDTGVGSARENYHHVLSRGSLQEMWEETAPIDEADGLRSTVGLSFFLLDFQSSRYVGHTGSQKAFISFFYIHPKSGTGAIAVFNSNGASGDPPPRPPTSRILGELRDALFLRIFPLFGKPAP